MLTLRELCTHAYLRTFDFNQLHAPADAYEMFGILSRNLGIRTDGRGACDFIPELFKRALIHDQNTFLDKLDRPFFATRLGNSTCLDFSWSETKWTDFKFVTLIKIIDVMYEHIPLRDRRLHTLIFPEPLSVDEIRKILEKAPRLQKIIMRYLRHTHFNQLAEILKAFPTLTIETTLYLRVEPLNTFRTLSNNFFKRLYEAGVSPSRFQLSVDYTGNSSLLNEMMENPHINSIIWEPPHEENEFTIPDYPNLRIPIGLDLCLNNSEKIDFFISTTSHFKELFPPQYIKKLTISQYLDFTQDQLNTILSVPINELWLINLPHVQSVFSTTLIKLNCESLSSLEAITLTCPGKEVWMSNCPKISAIFTRSCERLTILTCESIHSVDFAITEIVTIAQCKNLNSIICGKTTQLTLENCSALKIISGNSVSKFRGSSLPSIDTLFLPLASTIEVSDCLRLTTISAEKVTTLTHTRCDALAFINGKFVPNEIVERFVNASSSSVPIDLSPAASSSVDQDEP